MPGPSQATILVEMAEQIYTLHRSATDEPYALPVEGPRIARMLRGRGGSLRSELAATYSKDNGATPSSSALADAMMVIQGRALAAPIEPLHLRTARLDDTVWIDLGRPDGQALWITAGDWGTYEAPVVWRRTRLTGPMPDPAEVPDVAALRRLLNIADDSWPLLLAWMVTSWLGYACPILALLGEQGTGKSTGARWIVGAVDPSPVPLRTAPRDVESWVIAAAGSTVVALDNVSSVEPWLSDALCRAVTGDGMVRRALYTDDELSVVAIRRAVVLTAIDPGAMRGDLADRLLAVELDRITELARRADTDLDSRWAEVGPAVLAGLADLTAGVMAVLPGVRLDRMPRMADFARVLAAVDTVLGTAGSKTYHGQRDQLAGDVIDSDPVATAVRSFAAAQAPWAGTAGDLLAELDHRRGEERQAPRSWPKTPRALSAQLKRCAPALRSVGVEIERGREAGGSTGTRSRLISITTEVSPQIELEQALLPDPMSP